MSEHAPKAKKEDSHGKDAAHKEKSEEHKSEGHDDGVQKPAEALVQPQPPKPTFDIWYTQATQKPKVAALLKKKSLGTTSLWGAMALGSVEASEKEKEDEHRGQDDTLKGDQKDISGKEKKTEVSQNPMENKPPGSPLSETNPDIKPKL